MKKLFVTFVFALSFTVNAFAQSTPTAQQVIDKYIAALGGKQKLESVNSISMKNTISVMGMEMEGKTIKKGNKFKSSQSMMGQEMVQIFDGEKGYASQMGQQIDFPADKIEKMKKGKTIDALGMEASKVKSVTSETVDGKNYNVLTSDEGKLYFDSSNNLLFKTITPETTVTIKKYVDVNGVKIPEEMTMEAGGQNVEVKNFEILINQGVKDEDFK